MKAFYMVFNGRVFKYNGLPKTRRQLNNLSSNHVDHCLSNDTYIYTDAVIKSDNLSSTVLRMRDEALIDKIKTSIEDGNFVDFTHLNGPDEIALEVYKYGTPEYKRYIDIRTVQLELLRKSL